LDSNELLPFFVIAFAYIITYAKAINKQLLYFNPTQIIYVIIKASLLITKVVSVQTLCHNQTGINLQSFPAKTKTAILLNFLNTDGG